MKIRINRSARPGRADAPQSIELSCPEIGLFELGPIHLLQGPIRNVFAADHAAAHAVSQRIAIPAVHEEELRSKRCEIDGLARAVQHQRQKRRLLSSITSKPKNGCQVVSSEVELGRLTARRICETHGYCMCL